MSRINEREWLEIIQKNEKEILEVGAYAYAEAMRNPHRDYVVELGSSGSVECHYHVESEPGNHTEEYIEGKSLEVMIFSMQNQGIEITDDAVEDLLREEGYSQEQIAEFYEIAEEENIGFQELIKDKHPDILDKCENIELENDISNYRYEEAQKN